MCFKCKFLFLIFSALLLSSCSAPKEPIKVGVVLPLSGPFQIYGEYGLNGARLAVEEINAAGGVLNGHPLELVVRDNNTSPAKSVQFSRELIQIEDVFALMGPVSSAARYAMSEVASTYKIPQLYGIDYEGGHYSRYLVCYSTIPEHYVNPVIPYLLEHSGNSFYIFGYDYIWPHKMSERIVQEVVEQKGVISGVEFTPFEVKDYSAVFERIKASGAVNLMLILPGADGFEFLNQMSNFSFGREMKTVAFAADETYLSEVKPEALNGVLTALHFFSSWQSNTFRQFVGTYQNRFGTKTPATYSSKSHYDLIYLLKKSIEKAGVLDREKAVDNLGDLSLYRGSEKITLREDHHFDLPMYLAEFGDESLTVIKRLGTISPIDQKGAD
jgi:branched-chain amino acid transport system substrate-binding protein/urea transport system substrate-binding protein